MTLVHFHLTDAEGSGLSGGVSLVPTRRVTVRDAIRLPVAQTVKLTAGEATVEVMPSTTQWVWRASELVAAGATRYVEVPDSAQTVEYAGLVDVDPATLDQSSETVAAWETVTRAAQSALDQIESIDDKVTRAESSAQAAKASEGVAGQESAKPPSRPSSSKAIGQPPDILFSNKPQGHPTGGGLFYCPESGREGEEFEHPQQRQAEAHETPPTLAHAADSARHRSLHGIRPGGDGRHGRVRHFELAVRH